MRFKDSLHFGDKFSLAGAFGQVLLCIGGSSRRHSSLFPPRKRVILCSIRIEQKMGATFTDRHEPLRRRGKHPKRFTNDRLSSGSPILCSSILNSYFRCSTSSAEVISCCLFQWRDEWQTRKPSVWNKQRAYLSGFASAAPGGSLDNKMDFHRFVWMSFGCRLMPSLLSSLALVPVLRCLQGHNYF